MMTSFDFQPRTRVVLGSGTLARLGSLAKELGFLRTLLVADAGVVQAGYVAAATDALARAGCNFAGGELAYRLLQELLLFSQFEVHVFVSR